MDRETREAFANLSAALAIVTRRQVEAGETLARIEKLLTPEPAVGDGPSVKDLIAQLVASMRAQGASQGEYLVRILGEVLAARRDLPLETVQAIHDKLAVPRKAA